MATKNDKQEDTQTLNEEDDFVFGTEKKETVDEKKEEPGKKDDKKDDKSAKDDLKTKKTDEVIEEEEGKKGEKKEKEDKKLAEEDEDIFAEEKKEGDTKRNTLKSIAKKLEVDLDNDDDEEEFEKKVGDKLSKAKQEFNLDGYSDDAKALIHHLNDNGGDINSFFTNKNIISMQGVLSLDAETKVRDVRYNELLTDGMSEEEAKTTLDEEIETMSSRELKDQADDIDNQAMKFINNEVKKLVGDKEIKAQADRAKQEQQSQLERSNLKNYIAKQETFLGLKLTPEARKSITRDIDNGTFDKVLKDSPEAQKFNSYMLSKHGTKILTRIEKAMSESNRSGYNAATEKHVNALHKVSDDVVDKKTGHQPLREESTGKRPKWSNEDFE